MDNTEEISHLSTAEDLRARAAALGADMHEGIEDFASIFKDVPVPSEDTATMLPQSFRAGQEFPDAANSYAQIKGIYNPGQIALAGRTQFLEIRPEMAFAPDPSRSMKQEFGGATNIASLAIDQSEYENNGPTDTFPRPVV